MEGNESQQLAALISTWSIAERIDAGKALEGIEEHPGVQALLRLVQQGRETAFFALTHGSKGTENLGWLNKQLGFINGLEVLPDAIKTIRAKAEQAQEERDAAAERADAERERQA